MDAANEVQETIGRSYGLPEDLDEDDLMAGTSTFFDSAELDALQDEVLFEDAAEPSYLQEPELAAPNVPGGFEKAPVANGTP